MSIFNIIIASKLFKLTTNKYYFVLCYGLLLVTFALIYWYFGTSEHFKFESDTTDTDTNNITLLNAVYFATVTQTTTGYGDITPKSKLMRCVTILQLCLTVYVFNLLL